VADQAAIDKAHQQKMKALLHHIVTHDTGAAASGTQHRRDRRDARAVAPVVISAANSKPAESSTPAARRERARARARASRAGASATTTAPGNQYRSVVRSPSPAATAAYVKERMARAAAIRRFRSEALNTAVARRKERSEHTLEAPHGRAATAPLNDTAQPYEDSAHAQQHFLSVLRDIKEKLDEFHGVSADDAAFGRRWSSCAVVRAAASLSLMTQHCKSESGAAQASVEPCPYEGGRRVVWQVGNSGILLNASHGSDIDAHEAVFRMNRASVHNHETDVGTRTTLQIMNAGEFGVCDLTPARKRVNTQAVQCRPGDEQFMCKCVPNGDEAAITVRPTPKVSAERFKIARLRHPKTPFLELSSKHHRMCHFVVRQYATLRLGAAGAAGKEAWKEEDARATTGMVAVVASLALCDRVRKPDKSFPQMSVERGWHADTPRARLCS
jgi:hypothetical protein